LDSQARIITLAVLAIGAGASHNVPVAELLFSKAKVEASSFDETVNLRMVQFSMLLAEYQKNMGRPNSSYLHLGNASRKAFAMGLHRDLSSPVNILGWDDELQRRRSTIWYLCIFERYVFSNLGMISILLLFLIVGRHFGLGERAFSPSRTYLVPFPRINLWLKLSDSWLLLGKTLSQQFTLADMRLCVKSTVLPKGFTNLCENFRYAMESET
jgi:hypothetical protein